MSAPHAEQHEARPPLQAIEAWGRRLVKGPLPPATAAVCSAMVLLYLLSFIFGDDDGMHIGLSLVAAYALPPYNLLWTLLTAPLLETTILTLIPAVALTASCGRYFETLWGTKEFARFMVVVCAIPSLITVVASIVAFAATFDTRAFYGAQVHGAVVYLGAFGVAFKQLVPSHALPVVGITAQWVPLLHAVFVLAVSLLHYQSAMRAVFFLAGPYVAWLYLRFFQNRSGTLGDRSEAFAFASFFPEPAQPAVKALSTICFRLLFALRICTRPAAVLPTQDPNARFAGSMLGTDPSLAERRRNKAQAEVEAQIKAREVADAPAV